MKVLFIVTAYPRHEGDVITPWMGETIDRLKQTGIDVEVLAPSYKGSGTQIVRDVKVHRFRYAPAELETLTHDVPAMDRIRKSPLMASLLPGYIAAGSAAAARVAREGNFDVVHAFWPIPHGLFGLAARSASQSALVSTFFSSELNWQGASRKIFGPMLQRIVENSDAVTVISTFTGERLREFVPGAQSVIIPFGAAAGDDFGTSYAPTASRSRTAPFNLLFVGRLVRRKGVDVLLNAVAQLSDDPRLHVHVVGEGPEKKALIAESTRLGVDNRVTFEGGVSAERIKDFFGSCDALVLPAIVTESGETEGLGVVLLEAMGYHKPVIASSAGGITDIVVDGKTGLLSPPGDAAGLARTISTAMDDPSRMALLAEQGFSHAKGEFGWDTIVSRLTNTYHAAIQNRTGAKQAF
ncbi:MAG TPA: glycosyltransferase family 4 protein [Gemmatimonadaceae bacterium]|nr:glycosyltransferase family 4 protein [Gemmatimonadaceae bacterium]